MNRQTLDFNIIHKSAVSTNYGYYTNTELRNVRPTYATVIYATHFSFTQRTWKTNNKGGFSFCSKISLVPKQILSARNVIAYKTCWTHESHFLL